MGAFRCCVKSSAVVVAIFSVFVALLISGGLKAMGLFRWQDQYVGSRGGPFFKGMTPVHHEGTPWGFTHEEIPDLSSETIFVTGGNAGLGYWTAHHLADNGATVVIGCRSQKKCDKAAASIKAATGSSTVETTVLDLASFDSIRACAAAVSAAHPSLDSLILNAGVMVPPFTKTREGLELQIGVNHFGHFLLTKLLMPNLEAAAQKGVATIVSVSSAAHYDSYPEGILPTIERMNDESTYARDKAYGQSKLANLLFAQELAARVKDKNILVNAIHPGGVDTELARHAHATIAKISLAVADFVLAKLEALLWQPTDASLTQIYAAVGPSLRQNKVTGKYFHPIARETNPDLHAVGAQGAALRARLWQMSEDFIASH